MKVKAYFRKIWERIIQKLKIIRGDFLTFFTVRQVVNCPKCNRGAILHEEDEFNFYITCPYCKYKGEVDDDYFL